MEPRVKRALPGIPSNSSSTGDHWRNSRYEYPHDASWNRRPLSSHTYGRSTNSRLSFKDLDEADLLRKLNELKSGIRKIVSSRNNKDRVANSSCSEINRFDHRCIHPCLTKAFPRRTADPQVRLIRRVPANSLMDRMKSSFYNQTDALAFRSRKRCPSKVISKACYPIGIGAPFIICFNCSELLKLPHSLRTREKVKQKISCGACSVIISIEVENGKLFASLLKDQSSPSPEGHDRTDHNSFHPKPEQQTLIEELNSSSRENQGAEFLVTSDLRQNLLRETFVPSANEIEVSFNVFLKTNKSLSQDSVHLTEDADRGKTNKPGRSESSFFRAMTKKSFFSSGKRKISINGHSVSKGAVEEASVHAGPIHPGDYWYDVRAGFWGVMGQPCLGIIPPFIKQFDYPMPANCADGNTSIFVNGRELHWKDLELLSSRGLPTEGNKAYIVEFSGRVLDERSGQELCFLRELAPNVQMANRGFGMSVPKGCTDSEGLLFSFW